MEIDMTKVANELPDPGLETPEVQLPSPTIKVDPAGDVILKVGDVSLLVSSKVLMVASTYFRALFGPNFSEGESLNRRYARTMRSMSLLCEAELGNC
jgi:hypothetical protein